MQKRNSIHVSSSVFSICYQILAFKRCSKNRRMLFDGPLMGPPGVLGIWGEWLFIFRELVSTGKFFRDLGSKLIVLAK